MTFFVNGWTLPILSIINFALFTGLYFLIVNLYNSKKNEMIESSIADRKKMDSYMSILDNLSIYGTNLIPVLISNMEGVASKTEDAVMGISASICEIRSEEHTSELQSH